MELEYLYEFTVIARLESFSRAAEELCISQSSLSKHVLSLERELGVSLLQRNSRQVTLTPAGAKIMPMAREISLLKDRIRAASREYHRACGPGHGHCPGHGPPCGICGESRGKGDPLRASGEEPGLPDPAAGPAADGAVQGILGICEAPGGGDGMTENRLIVGVTGASGAVLALALLEELKKHPQVESHVILSEWGAKTMAHETGLTPEDLEKRCTRLYDNRDLGAGPASGSFRAMGMAIIPMSMKTLAGVTSGYSDSLLLRAADVTMKERRRLVLVPRECPLSTLHLKNLTAASELGSVVIPPVAAYYNLPATLEEVHSQIARRVLGQFGLGEVREWTGL